MLPQSINFVMRAISIRNMAAVRLKALPCERWVDPNQTKNAFSKYPMHAQVPLCQSVLKPRCYEDFNTKKHKNVVYVCMTNFSCGWLFCLFALALLLYCLKSHRRHCCICRYNTHMFAFILTLLKPNIQKKHFQVVTQATNWAYTW